MALCNLSAYVLKEGDEHSTTAPHVRCEPEIHMVFDASYPRSTPRKRKPIHATWRQRKKVEIDETYVGGKEKNKHASRRQHVGTGGAGKEAVFALVERSGRVKSHHIPSVNASTLRPIITGQVNAASFIMTDEGGAAKKVGSEFILHS